MILNSPFALMFLGFIPIVILMYILKQKFEEREISSTFLWEQVLKDIEVNTPWQKLKKNLLLFLQILAISLLALALSEPFLRLKGKSFENAIIVVDNTGSMNAVYENSNVLEEAKKRAEKEIKSLSPGSKITIITSAKQPKIELSSTTDKNEAINKIKAIKPSNASGNIDDSVSLVKSMSRQNENYRTIFYTDKGVDIKGLRGEVVSLTSSGENVSLDYISHSKDKDSIKAIVRITNRGRSNVTREVSLYGESKILDIKTLDLKGGETKTVYFDKVPLDVKYIWAEITEKDSLLQDNMVYDVIRKNEMQKVLLVSEKNVFIEKVLSSINNIELYKMNPGEKIIDKYNLYIFDGNISQEIPADGNIMLINPPDKNSIVKVNGTTDGGTSEILKNTVTKYIENANFSVSEIKNIEVPYWGNTFLKIGDKPVGFIGELKGRKIGVLAFDFHKSDFPLSGEFPIFMNNMMSYFSGENFSSKASYLSGSNVDMTPLPEATEVNVQLPSGDKEKVTLKYPIKPFDNTSSLGIYKILQKTDDKEKEDLFAVNFPTESESNIGGEDKSIKNLTNISLSSNAGMDIQPFVIIALLILIIGEWILYVYRVQ